MLPMSPKATALPHLGAPRTLSASRSTSTRGCTAARSAIRPNARAAQVQRMLASESASTSAETGCRVTQLAEGVCGFGGLGAVPRGQNPEQSGQRDVGLSGHSQPQLLPQSTSPASAWLERSGVTSTLH
jgi:hypothetical protein